MTVKHTARFGRFGVAFGRDWVRTGTWTTLSCEDPFIVNAGTLEPTTRWRLADCDHAWDDVLKAWKDPVYQHISFDSAIFDQFHSRPSPGCQNAASLGGCKTAVGCNTHKDSGPAGSLILDSFVAVHIMFSHLHDALRDLALATLEKFGTKFGAPAEERSRSSDEEIKKFLSIFLDMIPLAALAAIPPSFKICEYLP